MRTLIAVGVLTLLVARAVAAPMGAEAYGLLKAFFGYDVTYPLHARVAGTFEHDGATWERIVLASFHDGRVPALLATPAGDGPRPVVLLMHGLSGQKGQWLGDAYMHGGVVAGALLRRGYAVMALDAQYHGDRAVYNDFVDPADMVFRRGWGIRFANMLTQTAVDYRRAIDYLETRSDVDAARVGVLGYSMGGHMAFIVGAVEPRVEAVVACVVPATPGLPSEALTFARDLGGKRLLMMMARDDPNYTVEAAQTLFDTVPGDDKRLVWYEGGHSLPVGYAERAAEWLDEVL